MMTLPSPTLSYIPYDAFVGDVERLAGGIEADGWRPHFIVGIGRGGLVPATFLSHRLDLPMLSVDHSAQVPDFSAALIDRLADRARAGERLLFVDDINDSGSTIACLSEAFAKAGGPADALRFAVLIHNIRSRARVDYWSRTIDRAEDKSWLVFPWEAVSRVDTIVEDAAAVPDRLA
jgi:hypoxanthine phosphoribosyltransferase